jgi:hypothetical protein
MTTTKLTTFEPARTREIRELLALPPQQRTTDQQQLIWDTTWAWEQEADG